MLALYRVLEERKHHVAYLVNMCDKETDLSRSVRRSFMRNR